MSSDHVAVDVPLDVLRHPFDDVVVPVSAWLEGTAVALVLLLPFPNDVHAHRVIVDRRH